jgi:hypothetical protein
MGLGNGPLDYAGVDQVDGSKPELSSKGANCRRDGVFLMKLLIWEIQCLKGVCDLI